MNLADLPADFAPIHLVRIDLPRAQGLGRFFDLNVAVGSLDFLRKTCEGEFALLNDGGLIDDSKIPRRVDPKPLFTLLKKAA